MRSLAALMFEKTRVYGSLEALRIRGRSISYRELGERALGVAAALTECGAHDETIGIVGQRKASSYLGVLGILFAGCHYTPINPKYSFARIRSLMKDTGLRFLVGDGADLQMLEPVLSGQDAPAVEAIIIPEGCSPAGRRWRDEISLANVSPLAAPVDVGLEQLAYLLYTSGSTGLPKGVQVANSNVLAFLRSMSAIYDLEPGFRASQTFDFSFDPSVSDLFFTWMKGGVLCVLPEEEVLLPHEYIRRENITFWNSVPSIAGFMSKMGHLAPSAFPGLRHSMFCGEQFPRHVADAWKRAAPNSTVENLYGPTEATIYISRHVYADSEKDKPFRNSIIPIGRPFLEHRFALVDDEGSKLEPYQVGEIVFSGPQVTRGYLHDDAKTASAFVRFEWDANGTRWYKSGDLGFYNADGALECIGRKDSQIKLGGRRIEIGEIEAVLSRYPETRDAVVVPVRDADEIVIGCVAFITRELSRQAENLIRQDSLQYLERIFFPKKILTIGAFPLAPSGKTDRKALAAIAGQALTKQKLPRQ